MTKTSARTLLLACAAGFLATFPIAAARAEPAAPPAADSGVVRVKSGYGISETIARIKQDVAAKGIKFFDEIDQASLAGEAGIKLRPSTLLVFGNPPLGIQFLTANPYAGLDWPVRMIVFQDADGQVWIAYTAFDFIAQRHHITDRPAQFKMASEVAASVASSAQSH
jgi:uncharacterized protein (DUF302 family)